MQMWLWTTEHLQVTKGRRRRHALSRQPPRRHFPAGRCALLAVGGAFLHLLDVLELEEKGPSNPVVAEALPGTLQFFSDLCHLQTARAAGEVGRICAELVFGYNRHPAWDDPGYAGCYQKDELISLEALIPGIASVAVDVVDSDGGHPTKAGPCASFKGLDQFSKLRTKLDGCLTGSALAKDRAAEAVTKIMIPAALDYPV